MASEQLVYRDGETQCRGEITLPEGADGPRPVVLVNHAWRGLSDFERAKCELLAGLGYVAVALDNFGDGRTGTGKQECAALIAPFMQDRSLLRARVLAGLAAARAHPAVDPARVAAIGFCFGGLCALDLARSGADVAGVVSFHGLLQPRGLPVEPIGAKVLVLHGYDDPMARPQAMLALAEELTQAGCDWQVHAYGRTMHAFTNPVAHAPEDGLLHNPDAERRALASMQAFLSEALG